MGGEGRGGGGEVRVAVRVRGRGLCGLRHSRGVEVGFGRVSVVLGGVDGVERNGGWMAALNRQEHEDTLFG